MNTKKQTQTTAQELKSKIIALLRDYMTEKENEINSGIEEGIYNKEENEEILATISQHRHLVEIFENNTPEIYVFVEGGNIQGMSATEPMEVNVFDKDNLDGADDREEEFIDTYGTPDEWDDMIKLKTEANVLVGIY